ncbi:MAG TPA: metallophosphoesterase [Thermoanaerobaculia bacterium]|jgi:hypothetical protein|nr:metallophosphoesterase [Thermoanaerobaculia bacterium]
MRNLIAIAALFVFAACASVAPAPSTEVSVPKLTVGPGDALFIGAGDIAVCPGIVNAKATGDLVRAVLQEHPDAVVFTVGDNVYENGAAAEFVECYDPAWGSFNRITRPTSGNVEYRVDPKSYYDYYDWFDQHPEARRGYYSYDLQSWHIVSLDSNQDHTAGSPQLQWLDADLKASTKPCTLAYWHHPRYSSSRHGNHTDIEPFWDTLLSHGADVVLNGHDHNYERFNQQDDNATPSTTGIAQFVVGMGGKNLYDFTTIQPNSGKRDNTHYGILALTLHAGSYDWALIGTDGLVYDQSSAPTNCNPAPR